MHLSSTQAGFSPVIFHLYVNGFAFATPEGMEASVSLSPFSLVRFCRFAGQGDVGMKCFKVSLREEMLCCFFGVRGTSERAAEAERYEWAMALSHVVLLITDSVLPRFSISCEPLQDAPHTRRRLLAGYLVHMNSGNTMSVYFCELHAQRGASAHVAVYENHECNTWIKDIPFDEHTACDEAVGINSSCFFLGKTWLAAQSPALRKLWIRAIDNLKVKIRHGAPEPSDDELPHHREAIKQQAISIEAANDQGILPDSDALINRCSSREHATLITLARSSAAGDVTSRPCRFTL